MMIETQTRVLILEDDEDRVRSFRRCFEGKGWEVKYCDNSSECIELLKRMRYDYVFLDHDLGGMTFVSEGEKNTGSEVARFWKENEHDSKGHARVIIHSYNPVGSQYMNEMIEGSERIPSVWLPEIFEENLKI